MINPWTWCFPLFVVAVDQFGMLGVRRLRHTRTRTIAAVAEALALLAAQQVEAGRGGRIAVAGVFAFYAIVLLLAAVFRRTARRSIDANVIALALQSHSANVVAVMRHLGILGFAVIVISAVLSAMVVLVPAPAAGGLIWAGIQVAALGVLACCIIKNDSLPLVPGAVRAAVIVIRRLWRPAKQAGLGRGNRRAVASQPSPAPTHDVVFIVCECLSRHLLDSDEGRAATPAYHRFLDAQRARLIEPAHTITSSACSELAYSSLFTGCSPETSRDELHHAPLIWAHAKARGYRTALFTSTSLAWANLGAFMLDDSLDLVMSRESLWAPAVNEMSMDDRILTRHAVAHLREQATPTFTVMHFNMLHHPFFVAGNDRECATPKARYLRALSIFDECFDALVGALRDVGRLERTAIAFVADHGEDPEARPVTRLYDLAPVYVDVPCWLYLPDGAASEGARNQAQANASRLVAAIDLYPTLLTLMGAAVDAAPFLTPLARAMTRSCDWFSPIPAERVVVTLNTSEVRAWASEPFALAHGDEVLFFHDDERSLELRLLSDDNGDHWPGLSPAARLAWLERLLTVPWVDDLAVKRRLITGVFASPRAIAAEYNALARLGDDVELHLLDNWRLFSRTDFEALCRATIEVLGITDGDTVIESGCGAGAFLDVLLRLRCVNVIGADFAAELIAVARRRVPAGRFIVADARDLSAVADASCDHAVAQGVFLYLPSQAAVTAAAGELVRVTRPGGRIFIGQLNDPERMRPGGKVSGNTIIPRDFWQQFAQANEVDVQVVEQASIFAKDAGYDGWSRMRYAVILQKRRDA
jgi:SAM-dependent methyltransferase